MCSPRSSSLPQPWTVYPSSRLSEGKAHALFLSITLLAQHSVQLNILLVKEQMFEQIPEQAIRPVYVVSNFTIYFQLYNAVMPTEHKKAGGSQAAMGQQIQVSTNTLITK